MTNYDIAFEPSTYRALSKRAATYYQDFADSSVIPLIQTVIPDADMYRYTSFLDPHASWAGTGWSENFERGKVVSNYSDFYLYTQQMDLYWDQDEIRRKGASVIDQKRDALLRKMAIDIDDRAFHGPKSPLGLVRATGTSYTSGGTQLAEGVIGQLTSIQNLDGTDSTLDVKGDIWYALNTMIDAIPFKMRKEGPPMILMTDEYVAKESTLPDRMYMTEVEGSYIRRYLMGEEAQEGRKIGRWIVSNRILAESTDATAGDSAGTTDTIGTDSRILLFVPDPRYIGRVISRGFSKLGETSRMFGTKVSMGWKGRACVFDTNCAEYSEAIAWA